MPNLPEALLARFTTPERASAIYGDLTELATTRSRLWFWTNYARALVLLGWRPPVAFVAGCSGLILFKLGSSYSRLLLFQLWIYHPVLLGQNTSPHPYIYLSTHPYIQQAVLYIVLQLWLLAPFAAALYGVGDRLPRLGLAVLLMTTGIMLSVPLLAPFLGAAGIVAIGASLASTSWRRPAITVVTTTVVGGFTLLNLGFLAHMACWIDEHKPLNASSHYHFFETGFVFPHTLFWVVLWSIGLLNMLVVAIVCSRMHKPLRRQRLTIA